MLRLAYWLLFGLLIVASLGATAYSQDRSDRDGRERDRGDQDRDDRDRRDRDRDRGRDVDPRDIIRMADDNNDGVIDPSEVGSRSGYYIRRAAERAGLDASKPIAVDKLMPALETMRAERNGSPPGSGGGFSGSSSGSTSSPGQPAGAPGVAGFGQPDATPKAAGFNVPLTVNSTAQVAQRFDQRVIDYVNDMLRERDVNKNGVLEKNEWTGRWSTPPEESDTNKDGILDMQELCVRISNRYNIGRPGSPPTTSAANGSPAATPVSTATPNPQADAARYRGYAEGLLRQYDANKDGKLDRDEISRLRPDHQSADVNKDSVITVEELQAKLQSYASSSSSESSDRDRDRSRDRDGDRNRDRFGPREPAGADGRTTAAPRKSFRISAPTERLPKGLPDWFLRSDGDADGQVSMAEYTTSWTEQLAAEFAKNDLNGDGLITPSECLEVSGKR